ncbi:MAG: PD40 domain-containing protein [Flavobacteriales bacterium]|nr:PD40 domain-containing protein [Flavobacteriales bacterium]
MAGEEQVARTSANPWNGLSFLDLYYSEKKTVVTWNRSTGLPGQVNGPFHEGPAVLAPDGRTLYFTRSNYVKRKLQKDAGNTSHLMLFRSTLDSTGRWSDMRAFAYNGEYWSTGHPALSTDGKMLYFASDRPGLGGTDIWRCKDIGTGWSEPENLGSTGELGGQ